MTSLYQNQLQAVVLFDCPTAFSPAHALAPFRARVGEAGIALSVLQETPTFALMTGDGDLHITVELIDGPADRAVLSPTLSSPYTQQLSPDAGPRVERHRAHAIVEVRQGVLPDVPELSSLLDTIGMEKPGHSLGELSVRANLLAAMCDDLIKQHGGTLVHWTHSNLLVQGERFRDLAAGGPPMPLMVHPRLFGGPDFRGAKMPSAGFHTLGAAAYLGQEIVMMPAPVPWPATFALAMEFILFAVSDEGYVVPDGETFKDADETMLCRVDHVPADAKDADVAEPHYRLTMQVALKQGFDVNEARVPERRGLGGAVRKAFGRRR